MKKHAAEHAKFRTLLSDSMDRLRETTAGLATVAQQVNQVTQRLATGDAVLSSLAQQCETNAASAVRNNEKLVECLLAFERQKAESTAATASAVTAITRHEKSCQEQWQRVNATLEKLGTSGTTIKMSNGLHPIVQGVLIAVISLISSWIATGALKAFFASQSVAQPPTAPKP
jgi:hypothetical protein